MQNQMLDDEEQPRIEVEEDVDEDILDEEERWNFVAQGLHAASDQEIFHPERQDWTLDQWIEWGENTFFEPVADIEGWQDVLRDAFTADFGEGSSRFWGDYIAGVGDKIVTYVSQIRDRTIVDEEREEIEDEDEDELEGDGRPLKLLELFKGTGSIGKAAKKLGFSVVSLDFDPIYTPDIETDILKWDYKKYHKETGYVPDLIWASPPCNTFSPFAYRLKERNTKTSTPYSARAKEGTAILRQTLKIIKYFQKLNPELLFVMENPRGMMRHDPEVKKLPKRDTTLYCFYGDVRYKPTDFFNNVPQGLELKEGKSCNKPTVLVANLPLNKRYEIPAKLSREILETMRDAYKGKSGGAFERPPDRTPEEVRELTRELRNQYVTAEILYLQAWILGNELQQRQQRQRMNRVEDQWTFFTAQLTPELQRHIVRRADEHLELEVQELRREVREIEERESEALKKSPAAGGARTHRENVLEELGLEDKGYSLKELADASGVSKSILQKVYNRGIGAYKSNPQSVRMKGTFKKNSFHTSGTYFRAFFVFRLPFY
jgi:site-specific DNA-cytosine methylase